MPILFASGEETVVVFGAMALIVIVPTLIHYIYRGWKTYQEIELKHEMIARGMSVDEIERVLAAGDRRLPPQA
jgi:hypothetical protein